jgi:hypothetical protein
LPSRTRLAALFFLALAGAFMVPGAAGAGGAVLAPHGGPSPHTVDMRVAIARGPSGTIRWSQVTVAGGAQALWLVPVRPGAALDWADESFLASLDDASDVRVVPELDAAPCAMPGGAERPSSWTSAGKVRAPLAVRVHQTESEARAHSAARGFGVSTALGARISAVYARGDALVSLELPASGGTAVSSPTLRVSDDGEAMLPFALTGDARAATRITAFVIAEGAASVPGMRDVAQSHLTWGPEGSNYASYRRTLLATGGGDVWLRESSGHGVLFDGPDADGQRAIAPFVSRYFGAATTEEGARCVEAAREARAAAGPVDRWCAPGALLRIPGGTPCVEESGDVDPAAFACGAGRGDLALALGGLHAGTASLTRLAGIVLASDLGADSTISVGAPDKERPVLVSATVAACPPEQQSGSAPAPPLDAPRPREPEVVVTPVASGGCGGGAVEIYDDGDEAYYEESSSSWDDDSWDDASEACSGSTSPSSSGYYDDDDTDDDDSCSGSSSSSSSSSGGSDDDGWDSSDDDDGWDTASAAPKKHARSTESLKPKTRISRPKSPVSRYALLFVAVLLPLRRRFRPAPPRF